jgi:putative addiction module component (TIGR02574 family)
MNKIDEAWQALKALPQAEQERLAEVILDYVAQPQESLLSDEQVAKIEARVRDRDAPTMTIDEVRAHLGIVRV